MSKDTSGVMDSVQISTRYPVLRFFEYAHLPQHLADVSAPFRTLAWDLACGLPYDTETSVALRKLLEAKDAAVRAVVAREVGRE